MGRHPGYIRVERCQVCSSEKLRDFIDIGQSPNCNCVTADDISKGLERMYPLTACYCENCWCVQSRFIVNPYLLFSGEYHHVAGIPLSFRKNANDLATSLVKRFSLGPGDTAVDIGSNDGTLLEQYKPYGINVLGVDPSAVARIATERGIPTVNEFFEETCAWRILEEHGPARVVTAMNTFAHVAALNSFVKGVRLLLEDDGVFVTESHYLLDLIEKLQYDFIYHEHLRYYSVRTLSYLFALHDMEVFDVQRIPAHAGSIRVFACKRGSREISREVGQLIRAEEEAGLFSANTYKEFATRAQKQRLELRELLAELRDSGKRLVGLTYPCRGVSLMRFCNIGSDFLEYITDNTPVKIGKYAPGSHLRIMDERVLFEEQPDYGLLFSWHLSDEIIPKFRARGYNGKFIIPLPTPSVV